MVMLSTSSISMQVSALLSKLSGAGQPVWIRSCAKEARIFLERPLTVAVTSRTSAGKSTLVNALLGSNFCPTSINTNTMVVSIFHYSDGLEYARVICKDGAAYAENIGSAKHMMAATDEEGRERLENIEKIEWFLNNPALLNLCLIDTPGIDSVGVEQEKTYELFEDESTRPDILVYMATSEFVAADIEACQKLQGLHDFSAMESVFLLSSADRKVLNPGRENYIPVAEEVLADNLKVGTFSGVFAAWVPVAPLYACIASEWSELRDKVVKLKDWNSVCTRISNRKLFLDEGYADVDVETRKALIEFPNKYGLKYCIQKIQDGCSVDELPQEAYAYSNMGQFMALLNSMFISRQNGIRCLKALNVLQGALREQCSTMNYDQRYEYRGVQNDVDSCLEGVRDFLEDTELMARVFSDRELLTETEYSKAMDTFYQSLESWPEERLKEHLEFWVESKNYYESMMDVCAEVSAAFVRRIKKAMQ